MVQEERVSTETSSRMKTSNSATRVLGFFPWQMLDLTREYTFRRNEMLSKPIISWWLCRPYNWHATFLVFFSIQQRFSVFPLYRGLSLAWWKALCVWKRRWRNGKCILVSCGICAVIDGNTDVFPFFVPSNFCHRTSSKLLRALGLRVDALLLQWWLLLLDSSNVFLKRTALSSFMRCWCYHRIQSVGEMWIFHCLAVQ
jgi:hypothetical protein